jgi:hypothetical protein
MILVWKRVYIPLGYKYDVGMMVDDVLDLLNAMFGHATGTREIHWPSNTFAAIWDVRWDAGKVSVASRWRRVLGGTEALLAASGNVSVTVDEFLCEWKRPLELVDDALRQAGYRSEQLPRLSVLNEVIARLPRGGQLYPSARQG